MAPLPDHHDWPTKAETAQALGCGIRMIERMATAGKLQVAYRQVPHRRAVTVCNPSDVQRLAGERRAAAPFAEPISQAVAIPGQFAIAPPAIPPDIAELSRKLITHVPLKDKAFLTMDEAVEYSGLPSSYLQQCVRQGRLLVIRATRWVRINRKSLEALGAV